MKITNYLLTLIMAGIILTLVLSSCNTNNNVVSSSVIQKRKYNKGWHVNIVPKTKKHKTDLNFSEYSVTKTTNQIDNKINFENIDNITASTDNNIILTTNNTPDIFLASTKPEKTNVNKVSNSVIQHKTKKELETKQTKENKEDEPKPYANQMVALALVFFFGLFGIHRFYLGYIGIGIIQLLTGGCCGIWALVDLIRIATGDLKPKNSDYAEKISDY